MRSEEWMMMFTTMVVSVDLDVIRLTRDPQPRGGIQQRRKNSAIGSITRFAVMQINMIPLLWLIGLHLHPYYPSLFPQQPGR
jgi:hypothetical protein